jgi:hypothetical protein
VGQGVRQSGRAEEGDGLFGVCYGVVLMIFYSLFVLCGYTTQPQPSFTEAPASWVCTFAGFAAAPAWILLFAIGIYHTRGWLRR